MEGKGASVGPDAWVGQRKGRAWPAGSLEADHTQVASDGSRSAGHAGPFTENRVRLRVRCQSTDVHISIQQDPSAQSCIQALAVSILWWMVV